MAAAHTWRRNLVTWIAVLEALAGLGIVLWVAVTAWGGVVHSHPAYPVLLVLTALGGIAALACATRLGRPGRGHQPRPQRDRGERRRRGFTVLRIAGVVLAAGWIAAIAWLRPHSAVEPALAAMRSDSTVSVSETATRIVIRPTSAPDTTGVFFQPGALVDARAYAAALRPEAEQGHIVVIAKQPLDIAFLATGAFSAAQRSFPQVTRWVIGGHSLGGTVAAIEANDGQHDSRSPVVGLFFWASYPASDLHASLRIPVLSVSGSRDGLATPADIAASRRNLPANTTFTVVQGGNHADFGAYGPQPGDHSSTITSTAARNRIVEATSGFVARVSG
ncbi:alpha/beta family hydrolase [Curtobacterium ammoniigenes]|uniref:alpha/beta family hydrolase n=1 Tax=Curtobacterium ammoniigenes TaxID=395387 RepID=UPI0008321041|nr:alpha/beta family hydrolase [Curtobacterium ammoniigenes]